MLGEFGREPGDILRPGVELRLEFRHLGLSCLAQLLELALTSSDVGARRLNRRPRRGDFPIAHGDDIALFGELRPQRRQLRRARFPIRSELGQLGLASSCVRPRGVEFCP